MRDFRNLDAWHKAHAFTLAAFHATESFPKSETFALGATIRRLAALFTMKIAEACGHDTSLDFAQGLRKARGAAMEVEYSLLLARDLQYMQPETYESLLAALLEARRMLSGLIKSAESQIAQPMQNA